MNKNRINRCAPSAQTPLNLSVTPMPTDAKALRPKSAAEEGCPCSSGQLRLRLTLRDEQERCRSFEATLYNEAFIEMARCETARCPRGKNYVTLRFDSERCYLPGTYQAVITQGGAPYLVARFQYDGREETPCTLLPLSETDAVYRFVCMRKGDMEYSYIQLQQASGIDHLRSELIQRALRGSFNRLCSKFDVPRLRISNHFAIKGDEREHTLALGHLLPTLLGLEVKNVTPISCLHWAKELNKTPRNDDWYPIEDLHEQATLLTEIGVLLTEDGSILLAELEQVVSDPDTFCTLILLGTDDEVESLLQQSPRLAAAIPSENRLELMRPSVGDQLRHIDWALHESRVWMSPQAEQRLVEQLTDLVAKDVYPFMLESHGAKYVWHELIPRMKQRLAALHAGGRPVTEKQLRCVVPADIDLTAYLRATTSAEEAQPRTTESPADEFAESMAALNELVGLHNLKESLQRTFLLMRFNEMRRRMGLSAEETGTHHMIFTGNPGTGKTTVAALIGRIYRSMGLLSKGEVVSVERHTLVGRYIGQTEETMREVLEKAKGNVLFIDEAYTLCDTKEDRKDFGNHVIESLLTILAKPHPDMVVIMAGYANEMERLMEMNQGLKGRFAHHFDFDDYNAEELMQIGENLLTKQDYVLSEEARDRLHSCIDRALEGKDRFFDNARWINRFLRSGVLPAMATRVMADSSVANLEMLRTILPTDIDAAMEKYRPRSKALEKPRRVVGFRA